MWGGQGFKFVADGRTSWLVRWWLLPLSGCCGLGGGEDAIEWIHLRFLPCSTAGETDAFVWKEPALVAPRQETQAQKTPKAKIQLLRGTRCTWIQTSMDPGLFGSKQNGQPGRQPPSLVTPPPAPPSTQTSVYLSPHVLAPIVAHHERFGPQGKRVYRLLNRKENKADLLIEFEEAKEDICAQFDKYVPATAEQGWWEYVEEEEAPPRPTMSANLQLQMGQRMFSDHLDETEDLYLLPSTVFNSTPASQSGSSSTASAIDLLTTTSSPPKPAPTLNTLSPFPFNMPFGTLLCARRIGVKLKDHYEGWPHGQEYRCIHEFMECIMEVNTEAMEAALKGDMWEKGNPPVGGNLMTTDMELQIKREEVLIKEGSEERCKR
ncbi:hypothetical protein BDK51DRAFT_28712 [Blyttiomyces helicus]|uniref:Uncharacterized protein n=1 Tax=Blyttiomyces helicus TaxID=388810 RepID=A0A4P9WMN5_9FUNG|nr:hypothetical protein BDK51DRAFT_28712 [Blyttiomyces helicus]|eukprot:RKO92938.1 hypothetical protein BDK51DRAFT_28712 [Blyttiomyces helicus]